MLSGAASLGRLRPLPLPLLVLVTPPTSPLGAESSVDEADPDAAGGGGAPEAGAGGATGAGAGGAPEAGAGGAEADGADGTGGGPGMVGCTAKGAVRLLK